MRVLVIGGRGFVGSRVLQALHSLHDIEVWIGSRTPRGSNSIKADLNNQSTFSGMNNFDYVINCSDSIKAPPDNAINYCLIKGLTFLEASADLVTIDRILTKMRGQQANSDAPQGMVILGIGLFPGLSNVMARAAFQSRQNCQRLDIGVELTPLAGSGLGTASLGTRMLEFPAVRYEDGQRVTEPSIQKGIKMPFWSRERRTMQMGMPESVMLHYSTGVATTATFVATRPPAPGFWISFLSALLSPRSALRRPFIFLMRHQFNLFRTVMLRRVREPIELTAQADKSSWIFFRTNDGFLAIGYVIAAALSLLASKPKMPPGLYLPDEVFGLSELVSKIQALAGNTIEISLKEVHS